MFSVFRAAEVLENADMCVQAIVETHHTSVKRPRGLRVVTLRKTLVLPVPIVAGEGRTT
jgi:hypothetical protein